VRTIYIDRLNLYSGCFAIRPAANWVNAKALAEKLLNPASGICRHQVLHFPPPATTGRRWARVGLWRDPAVPRARANAKTPEAGPEGLEGILEV
jgi:hypothetical protein